MTTNKALWQRVCKTDPRHVKPITGKSYQGNSPKPYWLIERATEEFGPVGIGWGVVVKSERFERLSETDVLHVAVVSVWFMKDGKRSETFDQMGGTKAAYKTAKGSLMVDEDAGKKSVTDGMVKCLSMIGFAGDIFSGMWDDSKYVQQARADFEEKDRLEARQAWLDTTALSLESCNTPDELKAAWSAAVATTKAEQDTEAYETLKPVMERMAAHIKANKPAKQGAAA
jgi:hypothetical protein